jgi:hypothetical protein
MKNFILSAAGLAALLAIPASATPLCPPGYICQPQVHGGGAYGAGDVAAARAPKGHNDPRDIYGNIPGVNGVGPYTPGIPQPRYGDSGDFQSGGASSR